MKDSKEFITAWQLIDKKSINIPSSSLSCVLKSLCYILSRYSCTLFCCK